MSSHICIEIRNKIFLKTKDCFTVRAMFPKGHKHEGLVADFVMSRKEVGVIPGTRKPILELGTLEDDLIRRDFTVNSLCKDENGNILLTGSTRSCKGLGQCTLFKNLLCGANLDSEIVEDRVNWEWKWNNEDIRDSCNYIYTQKFSHSLTIVTYCITSHIFE